MRLLRGQGPNPDLFDPERERALLEMMVRQGPLVDGVTGRPTATVDGLAFERYAEILTRLDTHQMCQGDTPSQCRVPAHPRLAVRPVPGAW